MLEFKQEFALRPCRIYVATPEYKQELGLAPVVVASPPQSRISHSVLKISQKSLDLSSNCICTCQADKHQGWATKYFLSFLSFFFISSRQSVFSYRKEKGQKIPRVEPITLMLPMLQYYPGQAQVKPICHRFRKTDKW